jgi:hypothetical protein
MREPERSTEKSPNQRSGEPGTDPVTASGVDRELADLLAALDVDASAVMTPEDVGHPVTL